MTKVLWTQRQDIGPGARAGHMMAYDAERSHTILFGGRITGGAPIGDTWAWDGANWTQLNDIGPGPRAGHAMAFDADRKRVVLFGGETAAGRVNDTWEWDGADWTQVADTGPDPRHLSGMVADAVGRRLVLFGGEAADSLLRDTWEWDGADWTQVDDGGPPARSGHAMAFDAQRSRVVLFGGASAVGPMGDTWERDDAAWTQVQDVGPPPSVLAAMVFDGAGSVLFGGFGPAAMPPEVHRSTWGWSGEAWTEHQDIGPMGRWGHAMVRDAPRGRPVLFGGVSVPPSDQDFRIHVLGDTWEATVVGPGDGGATVRITSFTLTPNPAPRGMLTVLTATIEIDRVAVALQVVRVDIFGVGVSESIQIPAGSTLGTTQIRLRPTIPGTYPATATLGSSVVTVQLTIV